MAKYHLQTHTPRHLGMFHHLGAVAWRDANDQKGPACRVPNLTPHRPTGHFHQRNCPSMFAKHAYCHFHAKHGICIDPHNRRTFWRCEDRGASLHDTSGNPHIASMSHKGRYPCPKIASNFGKTKSYWGDLSAAHLLGKNSQQTLVAGWCWASWTYWMTQHYGRNPNSCHFATFLWDCIRPGVAH